MSKHIQLTARNFYEFSATVLLVQMTHMAFSITDMAMVARLGIEKAGGAGLGELVLQVCLAPLYGLFTIYSGQLARLEGSSETRQSGGSLLAALGIVLAVFSSVLVILVFKSPDLLRAAGQPAEVVNLTSHFLGVRSWGLPVEFVFAIFAVSLRVLGLKGFVLRTVALGLFCNVALNWLFLFGPAHSGLDPMRAVAFSTVLTYCVMVIAAFSIFYRNIIQTGRIQMKSMQAEKVREFVRLFLQKAPLLGIRNLNDFAVSAVVTLLMGTMGPETLSAAAIASSIIVFLYRVPQACCSATYTYYSYHLNKSDAALVAKRLFLWSALPTAVAGLGVYLASPWLPAVYGITAGSSAQLSVISLLSIYLAFLPFYFCEHLFSVLLNARLIALYPSVVSSLVSYSITIPFAVYATRVWISPEWTLASQGIGSFLIAAAYAWHLREKESAHGLLPQSA